MAYQVVRIEIPPGGRHDDADWRSALDHQTTDQVVAQKVAHLRRAGWEHVATTPDSIKDPLSRGLLIVFWRADPDGGPPAQRGPGDGAWVRDYPSDTDRAGPAPVVDGGPVVQGVRRLRSVD